MDYWMMLRVEEDGYMLEVVVQFILSPAHTHIYTRQEFMKAVMGQDMAAMQRFAADPDVVRMMTRFQELAMEVQSIVFGACV